jgi:hypothetical protein
MLTLGLVSIAYRKLTPAEIIPPRPRRRADRLLLRLLLPPGRGAGLRPLPGRPSLSPERE